MLVYLIKAWDKEKEIIFIVKELFLKVYGQMIKKSKDSSYYLTEISSKVHLKTIFDIMACIGTKMVTHTKAHGKMISNKDLVN